MIYSDKTYVPMKVLCGRLDLYEMDVRRAVDKRVIPPPITTPAGDVLYDLDAVEAFAKDRAEKRAARELARIEAGKEKKERFGFAFESFPAFKDMPFVVHDPRLPEEKEFVPYSIFNSGIYKWAIGNEALMSEFVRKAMNAGRVIYDPERKGWTGVNLVEGRSVDLDACPPLQGEQVKEDLNVAKTAQWIERGFGTLRTMPSLSTKRMNGLPSDADRYIMSDARAMDAFLEFLVSKGILEADMEWSQVAGREAAQPIEREDGI